MSTVATDDITRQLEFHFYTNAYMARIMLQSVRAHSRPVVAVIGTTGVGKSNLAIALAKSLKHDGIVLSADSMQIYKGLDVITNKITKEEMKGVEQWGLDMVKPGEGNWEMGRWCSEADQKVCGLLRLGLYRFRKYQIRPYRLYVVERITLYSISYSHLASYHSKGKNNRKRDGLLRIRDQRWRLTRNWRNYSILSGRNTLPGPNRMLDPVIQREKQTISSYRFIDYYPR
jgi:energy-coupling factor transporter ATP-binding protein EcfA2